MLREAGYGNVSAPKGFMYRTGEEMHGYTGWELYTMRTYQRDGRNVRRYTGTPMLTDDGFFALNMKPHEFVNFEYKTK